MAVVPKPNARSGPRSGIAHTPRRLPEPRRLTGRKAGLPPPMPPPRAVAWAVRLKLVAVAGWIGWNTLLGEAAWDPYPFVMLSLALGLVAVLPAGTTRDGPP